MRWLPTLERLIITAVCVVISVGAETAMAAQITVGDLYGLCSGPDDANAIACQFYILGAVEGLGSGVQPARAKSWLCIPEGTSGKVLVAFMKRRLGEDLTLYPQDKMLPAISFVIAAFAEQYPCS